MAFGFFTCENPKTHLQSVELSEGWTVEQAGKKERHAAKIPGSVHADLLANDKIEDPFYRTNERELQWIEHENWTYQTAFDVPEEIFSKNQKELIFNGLDTYADVYLNDSLILKANNMFRTWEVPVSTLLKKAGNQLVVKFRSPINEVMPIYDSLPYTIPVSDNDQAEKKVSIFTRKAGYHYGWDWGPRFVTAGIWRPIQLTGWNEGKIVDLFVRQLSQDQLEASFSAELEVETDRDLEGEILLFIGDKQSLTTQYNFKKGLNEIEIPFKIENPELWWPNGLGEQHLYPIKVVLEHKGRKVDEKTRELGVRTVELIRDKDAVGESFYFKVNGVPVFMKGANYIPQDNLLSRVTPERYEHILESAKTANMNMIRVWGGGIYEEDLFYELCDKKGLLVWQDFMFACAMFPGDKDFLENVRQEAIDNVKRLRNHPSVALWCGNNETLIAWHSWGWQRKFNLGKEDSLVIWKAYEDLFYGVLPEVVKEYDQDRFYWPSSPSSAYDEPQNFRSGDVHYWGVWWGREPFSEYKRRIPRFMSEYGFQSFPLLNTVNTYTLPEDHDVYSDVMKAHQRSRIGNEAIEQYLVRDYKQPKDFENFLYVSQVMQAEGLKVAMEAHRIAKPYCMGSLYWQLDDCWPVASWSGIDYTGQWKALHYYVKKAFTDVLVAPSLDSGVVRVYGISDNLKPVDVTLTSKLMDFEGRVISEMSKEVMINPDSAKRIFEMPEDQLLQGATGNNVLLYTTLTDGSGLLSENILYFVSPKDQPLKSPVISSSIDTHGEISIVLKTDYLARNVHLSFTDVEGHFSDNFFDLLPGMEKKVTFVARDGKTGVPSNLVIRTLADTFQPVALQ